MNRTVFCKVLDAQEKMFDDPNYQKLLAEHEMLNTRFLRQLDTMNSEQQEAVMDYCGLLIEMHLRTLEFILS